MGKYHIFQEITEFAPKILKMGEIYTDSKMCWLHGGTAPMLKTSIIISDSKGIVS